MENKVSKFQNNSTPGNSCSKVALAKFFSLASKADIYRKIMGHFNDEVPK